MFRASGRPRERRFLRLAATSFGLALIVLSGCVSPPVVEGGADAVLVVGSAGSGDWETFHGFGRWTLDPDRQTFRIERSGLSVCADHRVVIDDESADRWRIRFETRTPTDGCPADGCDDCLSGLRLGHIVPPDVELLAVCDPTLSIYGTSVPGGARVTLRQTDDPDDSIICSSLSGPFD